VCKGRCIAGGDPLVRRAALGQAQPKSVSSRTLRAHIVHQDRFQATEECINSGPLLAHRVIAKSAAFGTTADSLNWEELGRQPCRAFCLVSYAREHRA